MNVRFASVAFISIMHVTSIAIQLPDKSLLYPNKYAQICVRSIDKLSCRYKDKEGAEKSDYSPLTCSLDRGTYYKMAYVCTAVKILNGYLLGKGDIEDDISKSSYTPDATNVLVPYLGFIKKEGTELRYVTKPWPSPDDKEKLLVFVSGKSGAALEGLSEAYNYFFNDSMSFGEIKVVNNPQGQSKHGNQGHTEEALLDRLDGKTFKKSLAVVVDAFSWLDVCPDCAKQMYELLRELQKKQTTPIIFRIVSQRPYKGILPVDLSNEYDGDPLSFQGLYTLSASLVTRIDPNIDRIRDLVIENLHTGVISLVLHNDINFWRNVQRPIAKLVLKKTSQKDNVMMIFQLKFPIDYLLIQANDILGSEGYQGKKVSKIQLLSFYNKLKSMTASDDTPCPLFLKYFECQTGYGKEGNALQWKKVLQGNATLRLAEQESTLEVKMDYISYYIENCLLYSVEGVSWSPLRRKSVDLYRKSRPKIWSDFNKPDNVENKNLEILENLIKPERNLESDDSSDE